MRDEQQYLSQLLLWPAVLTLSIACGSVLFYRWHATRSLRQQYNDWIDRARRERDAKFHQVLQQQPYDPDYPVLTAAETANQCRRHRLDARHNVVQLAHRCSRWGRHGPVNAVTEEFYDQAAQRATELQSSKALTNAPLYCVPVSVKEYMALRGSYSTAGLACRLRQRDEHDSLVVQVLRQAGGAVTVVKSNVPQLMMIYETVNHIYGRTRNPYDLTRTCGGSSGGDAALVAMGCVPLAICSDVAGSIRIPASFCGIIGFKPTSSRVSSKGCLKPRKSNRSGTSSIIPVSIGPLARTVEDCVLCMKALWTPAMFAADPAVPPLPFDDKAFYNKQRISIGYFDTDRWFEPCPTSKRAVHEAVAALQQAGHVVKPFKAPNTGWETYGLLVAINAADGDFRSYVEACEGEPLIDEYRLLHRASQLPHALRWLLVQILDQRRAHLLRRARRGGITVHEYWQLCAQVSEMKQDWSDAMTLQGVDALVFPAMPIPATPHGMSGKLTAACSYMLIANLLQWPCGAVPITTVRPDETTYPMDALPENQQDEIARLSQSVLRDSASLPVSVLVMATGYRDELCLRIMQELEQAVGFVGEPRAYLRRNDKARNGTD